MVSTMGTNETNSNPTVLTVFIIINELKWINPLGIIQLKKPRLKTWAMFIFNGKNK
jgi:hypothetical protein